MKDKHLDIRIRQCLVLAEASGCPRRKFGAVLVDPDRNVVLADGYNGGPRGQEGPMCRGSWCERDGLHPDDVVVSHESHIAQEAPWAPLVQRDTVSVVVRGRVQCRLVDTPDTRAEADRIRRELVDGHPPVRSGTRMEMGCHHAESNVIANAAANGVSTRGAWLIVTGEPCRMCAKLIHHAGIQCVVVVRGGYAGGNDGVEYLSRSGIRVVHRAGPRDPRIADAPYEMT